MSLLKQRRKGVDLEEINSKLEAWSPFSPDPSLRNVVTGVVAEEAVNVHEYEYVGCRIIRKMKGQPAFTFSFSRNDKALTLGQQSTINIAADLQEFTNLSYPTTEQHKESTEAKKKRDAVDLEEINSKLEAWSPFSPDPSLRKVVTGVMAEEAVNVHENESIGCRIIHKMKGQPAFTFSFSKKVKAVTLGQQSTINIAADRTIDCALLFQRFMVVSQTGELSLEEVMRYELSPFPSALFEARNVSRKADKPQVAHESEIMQVMQC